MYLSSQCTSSVGQLTHVKAKCLKIIDIFTNEMMHLVISLVDL